MLAMSGLSNVSTRPRCLCQRKALWLHAKSGLEVNRVLESTLIASISVLVSNPGTGIRHQARKWLSAKGTHARSRPSSRMRLSIGLASATSSSMGKECLGISGQGHRREQNTGATCSAGSSHRNAGCQLLSHTQAKAKLPKLLNRQDLCCGVWLAHGRTSHG